ncbi:hypothetical protein [Haliscomenobacter sp.]|uniref:hypothetical protein n=1 Tax=Haliscomenobacter sp. TaxID=2717303 RepID=UPI0035933EE2
MDLQQARILVRKINSLFKSMEMDGSPQPTPIERDLMLSYLRQLYQSFLDDVGETGKLTVSAPLVEIPVSKPEPKPEPEPVKPIYEAPKTYVPPVINVAPPVVETAPVVEIREEPRVYIPPVEAPKPPVVEVKPEPIPVTPPPPPPPVIPTPSTGSSNSRIEALFSFKKATELSEKLSEMPIPDLTKGMSINDRLLYMNELFGRDMSKLDEVLRALNNFPSLDSAKSYLMGVATQFNWGDDDRSEIAQSFIKLVRRRFV